MQTEFEFTTCSRQCAATERPIQPGEAYFSTLVEQPQGFVRADYSVDAWQGPPEDCVGWWCARIATGDPSKPKPAPADVLLNFLEKLATRPEEAELRYLLALMLLRRRIVRKEEEHRNDAGREVWTLFCPRRDELSEVIVAHPSDERAKQLQARLVALLYDGGEMAEEANLAAEADVENQNDSPTDLDSPE